MTDEQNKSETTNYIFVLRQGNENDPIEADNESKQNVLEDEELSPLQANGSNQRGQARTQLASGSGEQPSLVPLARMQSDAPGFNPQTPPTPYTASPPPFSSLTADHVPPNVPSSDNKQSSSSSQSNSPGRHSPTSVDSDTNDQIAVKHIESLNTALKNGQQISSEGDGTAKFQDHVLGCTTFLIGGDHRGSDAPGRQILADTAMQKAKEIDINFGDPRAINFTYSIVEQGEQFAHVSPSFRKMINASPASALVGLNCRDVIGVNVFIRPQAVEAMRNAIGEEMNTNVTNCCGVVLINRRLKENGEVGGEVFLNCLFMGRVFIPSLGEIVLGIQNDVTGPAWRSFKEGKNYLESHDFCQRKQVFVALLKWHRLEAITKTRTERFASSVWKENCSAVYAEAEAEAETETDVEITDINHPPPSKITSRVAVRIRYGCGHRLQFQLSNYLLHC